jgi:hypothetical protein
MQHRHKQREAPGAGSHAGGPCASGVSGVSDVPALPSGPRAIARLAPAGASAAGATLQDALRQLDWSRPWYAPVAARGRCWQQAVQAAPEAYLEILTQSAAALQLGTAAQLPLRFVAQASLPAGMAYEAHIAAEGAVPTRANLHDFFNALVWCTFPRIKAQLNALQARELALHGVQPVRGGLRDALTLFDENAVLFACAEPGLDTALRALDWQTLFVAQRAAWGTRIETWAFGHALMEKLVHPYKAITAHAWVVAVPCAYFEAAPTQRLAWLDQRVAAHLAAALHGPRDFAPLPVLGIPGWWDDNRHSEFYDDRAVFRTQRRDKPAMPTHHHAHHPPGTPPL